MKKLSLSVTFLAVLVFSIMATPQTPFAEAQDFSLTVSPSSQTHHPGAYVSYYIEVRSISGFSSAVTFTISIYPTLTGYNVTIEPYSVKPPSGQSAHAILTVGIPSGYTGYYTITVRGAGAGIAHDTTATLIVQDANPDFCVRTTTKWVKISPSVTASYSLNFTPIGAFSETVAVSVNVPPAYSTAILTPTYTVSTWPASGTILTLTITTGAKAPPGSYPVEIYSSGTTRFHADYVILVIQANGDFSISASPSSLSVNQGDTTSSTITVTSTSPFASPTSLTWSWVDTGPATGVTPSLSPATVTPTSGGSITSTLTITTTSTATKGTFTIAVTGTCYHLSHNVSITLTITSAADFTMTASPTSRTVFPSQSADYTVTITPSGGFDKTIVLTLSPAPPTGISYAFQPPSVTPPTTVTSTLTVYTTSAVSAGTYVLTIYGAGDGKSDTFQVTLIISSKTDSAISLSLEKSSIKVGESVRLSGRISPNPGSGQSVKIEYSLDGSAWSTLTTVDTDSDGEYTYTWTPPSKGSYKFRSSWEGSIAYNGDTSGEQTLTVETAVPIGPCIIATATYGSELSPEVQFLRSFRDQQVKSTFAGDQFMVAFNAWYYSFSSQVAQFIASNTFARAVMKVLLYPLIGILHLAVMTYNAFSFSHELAVVMAGLVASALIGVVYFSPLAILASVLLRRYRKMTLKMKQLRILAIVWVASLLMILVGEVALLPALVMASTALFVLSTLSLGALTVATALLRRIQ